MTNNNPKIDTQVYEECLHNWRMLHLGLFYSKIPYLISKEDIDHLINKFEFPKFNDYPLLDKGQIEVSIRPSSSKELKNEINSFTWFILWSSLGNIFRASIEGLNKENKFKKYMKNKLGNEFENYQELLKFLRNSFSHNFDKKDRMHSADIGDQKSRHVVINLKLDSEILDLGKPKMKLDLNIDFNKVSAGDRLIDLIPLGKIIVFADLCSRLSLDYIYDIQKKVIKSAKK